MEKLKLKTELYWRLHDDSVSVFTNNSDLQKRIYVSNPQKLFSVLKFLETPKSKIDLYNNFPECSHKYIDKIINFLKLKHYVYIDSDVDTKFSRLKSFVSTIPETDFDSYIPKLNSIKILILGIGTGGSFQLEVLKRIGIRNFTVIDKDKVESKNLCAQNFEVNDVGKYKVDVLKQKLQDTTTCIKVKKEFLTSYDNLASIVNLNDYDYIIDTMDDKKVNLQIISRLFLDYPNQKLILNGYLVQKQMSYLVDKNNYATFLEEINELFSEINTKNEISSNSGSIFNAMFMALSIGKIIFDDIFQVRLTNYAYADFFINDYFIGNSWEKKIFEQFSLVKKSLSTVAYPVTTSKKEWINHITSENYLKTKILRKPKLSQIEQRYVKTKSSFETLISSKKMYNDIKTMDDSGEIGLTQIKQELTDFGIYNFGESSIKIFEDIYMHDRIYDKKKRFDKAANLTLFNSGQPLVYVTEQNTASKKLNTLLHEIFHLLLYSKTLNTYQQEDLVLNYYTKFLIQNYDKPAFKTLLIAHLKDTLALYMNSFTSVQYEKYLINDNLKEFPKIPIISDTSKNEIIQILNIDLDLKRPFHTLKYVYATENNFKAVRQIYSLVKEGKNETISKTV
ncbi:MULTISPECIES: ThiF family adenylyltransferase [unclassified Lactobacillus]|uniref:ThiF family adenylyltransferase n=1 Tax=unclassified Lactobacillus TaxID=2620435 RepID=UPI0013144164|nr:MULTISPECIES: ThiF family adenylyltransferase [unclassified Lactobacillus]